MNILLTTLNAKYIHKNLALRWLYVSAAKNANVTIKEYTIKHDTNAIVDELVEDASDVIAFSIYIWNIEQSLAIIKQVKQRCNKHIIVGGPEVSFESYHLLGEGVDAISLGEGEIAFWQYIEMLESGNCYEVPSMYTKQFPNTTYAKVPLSYHESLQSPYFLAIDEAEMANRYFYFETSRGCPYQCEYCLSSTDTKVRMFSEEYVFAQLEQIAKSDVRIVKLLDRTFNVMPERALRIARYMNEHCTKQIFQFEIVAETLSEQLLTFFCEEADKKRFRFEIGVQSFHEKTLQAVGRIQNNARLCEVITRLRQAGVVMHVDLIAGLPYEGFDLFAHSFNSLYALHADEIQLGILKLLKGTNLKKKKDWYGFEYNENPPYDIEKTNWLSKEELESIHDCAHAVEKFYNSNRCRYTIDEILAHGYATDAFSLFLKLGALLKQVPRPYQPHQLFALIKQVCSDHEEIVDGLINYDYYRIFKQKPKMFLRNKVSQSKRKEIMAMFVQRNIIEEEQLYHYGHVDTIYYKQQLGYQLVLYNNLQQYPKRYFIKEEEIEEIV